MADLLANFLSRSQQDEGFNHCRMTRLVLSSQSSLAQAWPDVPLKLHQQQKKKNTFALKLNLNVFLMINEEQILEV